MFHKTQVRTYSAAGELLAAIPAPGRVFDRAALPAPELSDTSEQTPAAVQRTPSAEVRRADSGFVEDPQHILSS